MRAAEIVRKEIFQLQCSFKGSLQKNEQYDNDPSSLLALVEMILGGTSIENQTENNKDVKSAAIFGHGKTFQYIAAHTIAATLGGDWCKGLLFMHVFSGCPHSVEWGKRLHGMFGGLYPN